MDDTLLAALLLAVACTTAAITVSPLLARKTQKPLTKTVTVLRCPACNYTEKRAYTKGDYVGKQDRECPACKKARLVIEAIYEETKHHKKKPRKTQTPEQ